MKYISLIKLWQLYGYHIRATRRVLSMKGKISNGFESNRNKPFRIVESRNESTGQRINTLYPIKNIFYMPNFFELPPILEMEYLHATYGMDNEFETLVQLGYMNVAMAVYFFYEYADDILPRKPWNATTLMQFFEETDVIIEVEDLKDTPHIISIEEMQPISVPKIRSWDTVMTYGTNFCDLYDKCIAQSNQFKEVFFHIPVLLSLFICDYTYKFESWSKEQRLDMEQQLLSYSENLSMYEFATELNECTYGMTLITTSADLTFMQSILAFIHNKISKLNNDIGIISFYQYTRMKGPNRVKASIRLSDMNINWDNEMEKAAAEEKERNNEQAENTSVVLNNGDI